MNKSDLKNFAINARLALLQRKPGVVGKIVQIFG